MQGQVIELLFGELEHEVVGKAVTVSFDLLIEPFSENTLNPCKIGIQHDFLATEQINGARDCLDGNEGILHDRFLRINRFD